MDTFSLGCIFYFVLTLGSHPFGKSQERRNRILKFNPVQLEFSVGDDWRNLILKMINQCYNLLPSVENIILRLDPFDCNCPRIMIYHRAPEQLSFDSLKVRPPIKITMFLPTQSALKIALRKRRKL